MKRAAVCALAAAAIIANAGDPPPGAALKFVDVAAQSGLNFRHNNAATPEKYLIETMGSGAAWIDYDGDGLLDIYMVNSAATKAYRPAGRLRSALYRNNGDGTFTDVTERAGVQAEGVFGMGVAVGDYDNDGDADLYVAGYGRGILYRNEGNGRFTDATAQAGAANAGRWGSSAAWFDYDRDGRLDLAIANYVDWSPENNIYCGEQRPGYRSYCHPNKYRGQPPTLLRNRGDGIFEDASARSGIGRRGGNGLGIVTFDYNRDGFTDVFIANDSMVNFLFLNKRDGTFEEVATSAGVALGENGEAEAGMGVDAADFDGDGYPDLFVTHLDFELNRLYRHNRSDGFDDATFSSGLGYQAFHVSGFGTRLVDLDNDGLRDIFIANGHVLDNIHLFHPKTSFAEPKLVFRNTGRKFENWTARLGPDLARARVSRAAAFADYDNDGDIDVLVSNNGQQPELLRNDGGNRNQWVAVRLVGTKSNRDGVGAVVTVRAGDLTAVEERKGGMSYQSAHDPRLYFGLGARTRVDRIEVRWPSGVVDSVADLAAGRVVTIQEGGVTTSHREQAVRLLRAGKPLEALPHLEAAIRENPNDAESHDNLGAVYAQTGRLTQAAASFESAVRLNPDLPEAQYHLALAYDRMGRSDDAIRHFLRALRLRPEFLEARYLLGAACRKRGDLDGAARVLEEVARRSPAFAEARYNLGLILQARNKLAEAVEQLRAAVRLEPKNAKAALALGIALAEQGQEADAVAALRSAAALDPADPEARYNLGLALAKSGAAEAEAEFRAAVKLKPAHASARRALGVLLMHQGKLEDALAELKSAVAIAPQDAEAFHNLGLALLRLKRADEAVAALEAAVGINPNLIKAWNSLSQAYLRAGRAADSRRAADRGAELTAEERALGRAMVLVQAAGESDLREAVRLSPRFDEAHFQLGRALAKSGAREEAVAAFRRAIALNPSRADAHYEIGRILDSAIEFQEAARLAPCWVEPRRALARGKTAGEQLDAVAALDPGDR